MLELRDLTLEYPEFSLRADLAVGTRDRVALLGPSGAGKSTLLATIAGFVRPARGTVWLDGSDITERRPGDRGMAVVFQDQNLFPHMTAAQNLGLALSPALRLGPGDADRIEAALARVGLAGLGARRPAELSGGQQARVTLARVLLQRARLILLDEPFAALGPALSRDMLRLVGQVCDETGAGLIMAGHDPEAARALCHLTIVVAEGRASPPQKTDEVLGNPPKALAAYLGLDAP